MYSKQNWKNLPDQTTPISAERLNHLETQYEESSLYTDQKIEDSIPGGVGVVSVNGKTGNHVELTLQDLDEVGGSGRVVTIDDLPETGIVSAHRTGGDFSKAPVAPECTVEGAFTAIDMGAHIIDVDYRTTADGVPVLMHDTAVDRTTTGSGKVSDFVSPALPKVNGSKYLGEGWDNKRVVSVEEFLSRVGGHGVITIEAKEGVSAVKPIADLIKKKGLHRSVFINTNNVSVVEEIVSQGCLAHLWAHQNPSIITAGINAGATLLEVPANATPNVISQCQNAVNDPNKNLKWFIAGPIWTREQRDNIPNEIMGHVTDALGMTNRPGNDRLVTDIRPSLSAGKRGVGWYRPDDQPLMVIEEGGIVSTNSSTSGTEESTYFGDISADSLPSSYTLNFSFIAGKDFSTGHSIRVRMACTTANKSGLDGDTDGYVVGIRGTGELVAWETKADLSGGESLGSTMTSPLTAGQEYTISIKVTPSSLEISRSGHSSKIGPKSASRWRGGHVYLWFAGLQNNGSRLTGIWYS